MNTPYLGWIMDHTDLYEFTETYPYSIGDIVTYKDSVYRSLSDDNLNNNPITSNKWIKII